MISFSDSLAELRYERGLVSFRLHAARSGLPGTHLFVPIDDFAQMVQLLSNELPKIQEAHSAFQESVGQYREPVSPQENSPVLVPALGKKIATI